MDDDGGVRARLQRAVFETRRGRRRLGQRADDLRAARTLPRRIRPLRHVVAGSPTVAASGREIWRLHVAYARTRDERDRAALVAHYSGHARGLAKRFYREREPLDDLMQVAIEALILALDRFDPTRGTPFLGYANPTIVGTIKRYFRDSGWTVRVPRRVHALAGPVRDSTELLTQDLGRRPTDSEIADVLGVGEDAVRESMLAETMRSTASLDPGRPDDPGFSEILGDADPGMARVELRHAIEQSLSRLPVDDRALIKLYFVDEHTQHEIASELGCSQMQVSRSLRRILRRLRAALPAE